MNQLVWRGETVKGKYLGEVAILTELSPIVHCETFVDGHWRLWSYVGEKEQVIQQGKAPSLLEAQHVCEQTALAIRGLQSGLQAGLQTSPPPMPNMYMQHYPPTQVAYEAVEVEPSLSAQELRYKFRRWAISLTMLGGIFLSIWYSMMLKPLSTISLLLVLASIIWGAQAVIKSFKRPTTSVATSSADEGMAIFPNPQFPQARQVSQPSFRPYRSQQMQAIPVMAQMPQVQQVPQLPAQASQANFYNPHLQMHTYTRSNG